MSRPAMLPLGLAAVICVMSTASALQDDGPAQPPAPDPPASRPTTSPATRPADQAPGGLAGAVAEAHNRSSWLSKQVVRTHLVVEFGGETMLDATLLYEIHGGRSRLELADGTTLVFDGRSAWVSPAAAELTGARFHLLTWPYFMAAPFKLDDPGATLTARGIAQLDGKVYKTSLLTFDGVGDTPEDWYVLYTDLTNETLRAMAYIVTYGTTAEAAAAEPHAITYRDFAILSGAVIAQRWQFWSWSEKEGLVGDPIGQATLSEIRFVEPQEDWFTRPADAREDTVPSA